MNESFYYETIITKPIGKRSQRERIFKELYEHRNGGLPLNKIINMRIAQYSARIFELRDPNKYGFDIECVEKWSKNIFGKPQKHTKYFLITE